MSLIIQPGDRDETLDQEKGIEVYRSLEKHYPRHPWRVDFQGRVLLVRHEHISLKARELGVDGIGFQLNHLDAYSASQLAHNAMLAGGEMLERWGYRRGAWDGETEPTPDAVTMKELLARRHKQAAAADRRIILPQWETRQ